MRHARTEPRASIGSVSPYVDPPASGAAGHVCSHLRAQGIERPRARLTIHTSGELPHAADGVLANERRQLVVRDILLEFGRAIDQALPLQHATARIVERTIHHVAEVGAFVRAEHIRHVHELPRLTGPALESLL